MRVASAVFGLLLTASPWASPAAGQAWVEEPAELAVAGVTLHGTLTVPAGGGPFTVAVIVAGSGPTDRNGNSPLLGGANNSLKLLAEALGGEGIASLRYDKRAVGESRGVGNESDLRFTTYSDDAASWIAALRKDARFSRVIVIGHSEGALLGTIAARQASADGLILLAGAGRRIGEVMLEQLQAGAPALVEQAAAIMRELEAGRSVADVPETLHLLFRPSIQPYMMSWLPLDPRAELARVQAPRLVIQGTTDVQAAAADATRLGEADAAIPVVMIEGMNHVLKLASGTAREQFATSYVDPSLPLAPELVRTVVLFIRQVERDRALSGTW